MLTDMWIVGGAVAVMAAGAYLKWAAKPVVLAYRIGRKCEQVRRRGGKVRIPPGWQPDGRPDDRPYLHAVPPEW